MILCLCGVQKINLKFLDEEVNVMSVKKVLVLLAALLAMGSFANANLLTNGDCESGALGGLSRLVFCEQCNSCEF